MKKNELNTVKHIQQNQYQINNTLKKLNKDDITHHFSQKEKENSQK
jgi:hypothetical protein